MSSVHNDDNFAQIIARRRERAKAERQIEPRGQTPVSPTQLGLLMQGAISGFNSTVNRPTAIAIDGPLDTDALQLALEAVVARHETLRTRYSLDGAYPTQIIEVSTPVHIETVPLGAGETIDHHLEAAFEAELNPLESVPVRYQLVVIDQTHHVLVIAMSHLCFDGWSEPVLITDLWHAYAMSLGQAEPFSPLPTSFSTVARRAHDAQTEASFAAKLDYWAETLDGAQQVDLPSSDDADPDPYDPVRARLRPTQVTALRDRARDHGTTPFVVALTAVQRTAAQWLASNDLVIICPVAERPPGTEGLVAVLIDLLPLRTVGGFADHTDSDDLIRRVHEQAMEGIANRVPMRDIYRRIGHDGRQSLGPVSFQWRAFPNVVPSHTPGTTFRAVTCPTPRSKGLSIDLTPVGDEVEIVVDYPANGYNRSRVVAFVDAFIANLPTAAGPSDIDAEPAPPTGAPTDLEPVIALVAERVHSTPLAAAVHASEETVTYADLWHRSTLLAAELAAQGVEQNDRVLISGQRSIAMVVAMLATLRANAVMIPIDSAIAPVRRALIVDESRPVLAIAIDGAPTDTASTIDVDLGGRLHGTPTSTAVPMPTAGPNEPAYVMFTSGTSGRPKGIVGSHLGLAAFVDWERDRTETGPSDRVSMLAGIGFDVMLRDVFLALTSGATLCIPVPELDPANGIDWLATSGVTVTHITPSLARAWLASQAPGGASPRLRVTLFAGEPLLADDVTQWRRATGHESRAFNLYGPSETCLARLAYEVPQLPAAGIQPVGHPLPHSAVALDGDEVVIHTDVGTLGYLDAGAGTGFSSAPASSYAQSYRTGDRGTIDAEGVVTVQGRLDDQVKIGGVRIEPTEVAITLEQHPAVAQAAVLVQHDHDGPHLVAFYVASSAVEPAVLRAHLRECIAVAAMPRSLIVVESIPVTGNGKVDAAALLTSPKLTSPPGEPVAATAVVAAELYEHVRAVWAEVLSTEITDETDFFDAGGSSLRALAIVGRLGRELGIEVPLERLFDTASFGEFVTALKADADMRPEADPSSEPVPPAATATQLRHPITAAQEAMLYQAVSTPEASYLWLTRDLDLYGPLEAEHLCAAINQVTLRHQHLRAHYDLSTFEVVIDHDAKAPCRVHDLRTLSADETETLTNKNWTTFPNLEVGPLVWWDLFRLDDQHWRLQMVAHHSFCDGWSLRLLFRELSALYLAKLDGSDPGLDPAASFVDYANGSGATKADLGPVVDAWAALLAKPIAPFELGQGANDTSGTSSSHQLAMAPGLAEAVDAKAKEHHATPTMIAMSLWGAFLCREGNVDEVAIGLPAATRSKENEGLVGLFLSTLPIRVGSIEVASLATVVAQVRAGCLQAYDTVDVPFAEVLRELRRQRRLEPGAEHFDTMLQYLPFDHLIDEFDLGAVAVHGRRTRVHRSSVPLYLRVVRTDQGHTMVLDSEPSTLAADIVPAFLRRFADFCAEALELPVTGTPQLAAAMPPARAPSSASAGPTPVTLSYAQERMWFLEQIADHVGGYHVVVRRRFEGPLDTAAFSAALETVVARHEPLRTVVRMTESELQGYVLPVSDFEVEFTTSDPDASPAAILATLQPAAYRPFDLAQDYMLRARIIRLSETSHVVQFTFHHIAMDGWSLGKFWDELTIAYNANVMGTTPDLPAISASYSDVAERSRAAVQAGEYDAQLDHWDDVLTPPLPAFSPREGVASSVEASINYEVRIDGLAALHSLRDELRLSNYMVGLAVTAAITSQVTNNGDVMLGVPIVTRPDPEIRPLIGMFSSTLPMRVQLDPNASFRTFSTQVRDSLLAAHDNSEIPFDLVASRARARHRIANTAFFDAMFTIPAEAMNRTASDFHEIESVGFAGEPAVAKFALSAQLFNLTTDPVVDIQTRGVNFSREQTEVIAHNWAALLQSAATNPDASVHSLLAALTPLPADALNQAEASTLSHLAPLTEHTPAIAGARELTGGEFNRLVQSIAAQLAHASVGVGDVVAIVASPTVETVATMRAIWERGAAYLPLDPTQPLERARSLLTDNAINTVVRTGADPTNLDAIAGTLVVDAEAAPGIAIAPAIAPAIDPSSTAYLIPTSGSTGTPKLVEISHRALAAFCAAGASRYDIGPGDRVLQFHSLAFDAAVEEIWLPLAAGAVVVLTPERELGTFDRLLAKVDRFAITVLDMPTALWSEYMTSLSEPVTVPESLRMTLTGGQALPAPALDAWQRFVGPGVRLLNTYGPTETTVVVASADVSEHPVDRPIPIGHALDGIDLMVATAETTGAYVRSAASEMDDGWGELWIAGDQLATGYRRDAPRTAAAFVTRDGRRWYRTGDRARQHLDGSFEVAGRFDRQVKIGGHRVELDEVENLLTALADIDTAAVEMVGSPNAPRLVGAFVSKTRHPADVLNELRFALPSYMVPVSLTVHDQFPRTASDKIDRAALRGILDPSTSDSVTALSNHPPEVPEPVAPNTPDVDPTTILETVAAVFAEVLAIDNPDHRDDFFALGGRSLTAVRVVHKLQAALAIDLPVADIFTFPTIAELSDHIANSTFGVDDQATPEAPTPPPAATPFPTPTAPPASVPSAPQPPPNPPAAPLFDAPEPTNGERPAIIVPPHRAVPASALPTTRGQQRFWVHQHVRDGDIPYSVHTTVKLRGELDIERLRLALMTVSARHEVLRTRLVAGADGRPYQHIDDPRDVLEVASLGGVPPLDRELAGLEIVSDFLTHRFDLATEVPFRALVVPVDDTIHLFSLLFHHVAVDAQSVMVLSLEIAEAYDTGSIKAPVQQYRDIATQRDAQAADERSYTYWQNQLGSFEPPALPGRAARPEPAGTAEAHTVALTPETQRQLLALATDHRVSPFQLLVASSLAMVHRATGAERVSVGSPLNERQPGNENGIGPYVNMAALLATISPATSFAELLVHARTTVFGALEHSSVPFDQIVERLNPRREATRVPFFDVTCNLSESWHKAEATIGDASLEAFAVPGLAGRDANGVTSDLMVNAHVSGDSMSIKLRHDPGIIDTDAVAQLAHTLGQLLRHAAKAPDAPLGDLPVLSDGETRWLTEELNDTSRPFAPTTLDATFARVVADNAGRTAVIDGTNTLTYGELDLRSDKLAHELRAAGARPGHAVGIRLDRSADLVVAMLAIIRTGAAYVPVDKDAPEARSNLTLDRAGVAVFITNDGHGTVVESRPGVVGASLPTSTGEPVAYVMFTSGSTGEPKGVLVPHRAVQRLVTNTNYAPLGPGDVVAMLSNPAFDALTFEVWGPLMNGATIHVLDRDVVLEPARFAACLRDAKITSLFVTSALFNQVIHTVPDAFSTVRDVLVGGEALSVPAIRTCLEHRPQRLVNAYGPTETTTFATFHRIEDVPDSATSIPIGLPITNSTALVLDTKQRLVPPGVVGELYLGGPGVALGYLNDPALTRERFVELPYLEGRFYRTGDLVRRRRDGAIDFVGRNDDQIKLRGHRIELGEVQQALLGLPGVRAAAATVLGEGARRRLVGYVEADQVEEATARVALRSVLPTYMVPSEIHQVARIPLTPQGKLDIRSLQKITANTPFGQQSSAGTTHPTANADIRSPEQDQLLELFREAVSRPDASFDDDFFELGGHSLLAIELLAEIEKVFGTRAPMSLLFNARTPRDLAAELGLPSAVAVASAAPLLPTAGVAAQSRYVVTLRDGGAATLPPLWLVHPAGGTLMLYEPLAAQLGHERTICGVLAPGAEGERAPATSIDELAEHQLRHILAVQPQGPYCLLGYSIGGIVTFEVARRLTELGHRVELVGVIESSVPGPQYVDAKPERVKKFGQLVRNGDVKGLANGAVASVQKRTILVGPAMRRRAEKAAVDWLGVAASERTVRERVGAAMRKAFSEYDAAPADLEVVLIVGDETADDARDRMATCWAKIAGAGCRLYTCGGSHANDQALAPEHAERLAAVVRQALAD